MKKILTTITATAALLAAGAVNAQHLGKKLLVGAKLEAKQEIPVKTGPAVGIAGLTISEGWDSIYVNLTVKGLRPVKADSIVGIHIHQGRPGENGNVLVDLTPFLKGWKISTVLTANNVDPNKITFKNLITGLLKGDKYLNLHTDSLKDGYIRGQLKLEKDWGFTADITPSPAAGATSKAYGLAVAKLSKDSTKLKVYSIVQNLSSKLDSAHLHAASGKILAPLQVSSAGDSIIWGDVDPRPFLDSLVAGKVYINVHTKNFPAGEVWGYLWTDHNLDFHVKADAAQHGKNLPAKGVVSLKLSPSLDTLWYDAVITKPSGIITASHLHWGDSGKTGDVAIPFDTANGINRIKGKYVGDRITKAFIDSLYAGKIYFNAHTVANPGGELRGQTKSLARYGFAFNVDGAQEVPAVNTPATGTGIVTIDREWANLTFASVVYNLTGPVTAAHFHLGRPGETGDPIYTLTPEFTEEDSSTIGVGTINSTDNQRKLTALNAWRFLKDSIYLNIHTEEYPNGEVRGQVQRAKPADIITSTELASATVVSLILSPNPASDVVSLNFSSVVPASGKVVITNALGTEVSSAPVKINSGNNTLQLNVSAFETGLYNVVIETGNGKIVKKLVKN